MKKIILILAILGFNCQLEAQNHLLGSRLAMEYFVDIDPGVGNGIPIDVVSDNGIDETVQITAGAHGSNQFHKLYIRVKDQNNVWSIAQRSEFFITAPLPVNIVKLQYFFDTDPGVGIPGNGAVIPLTSGTNLNQNVTVTIPGPFTSNYHNLFIRTQNEAGVWSIAERRALGIGTCVSIPNEDIIGWWSFDGNSDNLVSDISGNHDGVLLNGALTNLYSTFDGSDDYIGIPDSDDFTFGTEDFSIEFFANFLNPGGDLAHPEDKFIGQSEGAGVAKKWTFALAGGKLFFRLSDGVSSQNLVQSDFTPVLNQWYHLAITRKADTLRTYINGVLSGSQVISGLSIPDVNSPLTIGWVDWIQGGSPGFMQGKLDEMTIYKRALTQAEINSIHNAGAGGKCKSIQISTPAISDAQYGEEFSQTLQASLGASPYSWSISTGELPEGVTLSSEGLLSGTPTEAGEYAITIQAKDADDATTQKDFVMKILLTLPPPQFTIFKSGTTAVPGREMDYFILIENSGNTIIDSLKINEFLEPWFTYISSSPTAEVISEMPNYFTEDTTDLQSANLQWGMNELAPQEARLISYKVKLNPSVPLSQPVKGCVTAQAVSEVLSCYLQHLACMYIATTFGCVQCAHKIIEGSQAVYECLLECYPEGALDCFDDLEDCWDKIEWDCDDQTTQGAVDPNEKLVLAEKYIQPDKLLPYVIHYENIGTIEARDIFIKDTLDADLDETTLNIITPGGVYNPITRVLKWDLYNVNLLPDSGAYVMYTVKPKPNLPSGTVIHNTGHIQFEVFDVFATNQTENIIDYSKPEGIMNALPPTMYQTAFPISWTGMDAVGEIKNYSIFVKKNDGPYELFLSKTKNTTAIFTGETGNTYSFICIAEDLAGNIEVQEPIAETTTTLEVLCENVYYYDADNDGYGNNDILTTSCSQPTGFVINNTDCNDAVATINPGTSEICNFIDDDCDGLTDEEVTITFYRDADSDGFGTSTNSVQACNQPSGYVTNGNDCDDTDSNVNPDVPELNDGIDNDCDGLVDEGFSDMSVDAGDCAKLYRGYDPAACTVLTVNVEDGSAPFTYLWNNGITTSTTTVCPVVTTTYTVTVTDNNGVSAEDDVTVHVIDIRCGNNNDKVKVCHGSSKDNLCIAPSAVQTHLDHGDQLGICNATDPCESQALVNGYNTEEIISLNTSSERSSNNKHVRQVYFSIKPNPANEHIEVQTNLTSAILSIIDVSGKVIRKEHILRGKNIINTSSLLDGIYFVRLENGVDCNVKRLVLMH